MMSKFMVPAVCPKCSGVMEEGLNFEKDLFQLSDDYVIEEKERVREYWQKTLDAVEKFLGRESVGKRRVGPRLAVVTFRCVDCGYLESYAPPAG